ncbi:MAG TPA: tryptophan 7-halogenase [Vicinamibacterales bacterium]|nr:tryptophan 7-halogenase [Vicinamibacterales bacterium]
MTAPLETDIAIVGSGFGGSILAMIARRLGLRVALLERCTHPRFAIGESASPLAGVILEQLARRYDLPRLEPLATYGAWRRHYPHVTCGLKRGFTYYKHTAGERFASRSDRANELLVAASPSDELSDTHWLRADVDHFLVQEAIALGVEYVDDLLIDEVNWSPGDVRLTGCRRGVITRVAARFLVDASGPHGFLSRARGISDSGFDGYPATQALFSHFTGVARCADMPEYAPRGFPESRPSERPPYAPDAAALHHVFDDGWMWVLRFDNGVTSAGVAVTDALAADIRLGDGEPAWRRLLARYPSIAAQFGDATPIREFTWMPRIAWRSSIAAGDRWAMLPSAAAFVDPLFSTGIPLTLLGIERLARALEGSTLWGEPGQARARGPDTVRPAIAVSLDEADHVARFIAGCYAAFPRFDDFVAWSMFYFATASFSEMSRRLHGDRSRGFMGADDGRLTHAMVELSPARAGTAARIRAYGARVADAIAPINVAGLADVSRRNWYGIDVEETVAAAAKLGAEPDQVRSMFTT